MLVFKKDFKDERVVRFIERYCDGVKKEVKKFYKDLNENPLQYKEQTFKSLVFPVLQKNSKRTVMEHYYLKANDNKKKKNFLDFYSLDKEEECSYLIEFKHGWDNPSNKNITKTTLKNWEVVNGQIKKLDKKSVNEYIDGEKSVYGMSIMNVVTYLNDARGVDYIYENKNPNYVKEKLEKQLKGHDWIWSWEIEKKMNEKFKETNENDATYTHLTILGKVTQICK